MNKQRLYLALTVVGAVVPMIAFVPWLAEHGLNLRLLVAELFVNRISTFFALDLILTGVVVAIYARTERPRVRPVWLVLAVLLSIGVSAALPLLFFSGRRTQQRQRGCHSTYPLLLV